MNRIGKIALAALLVASLGAPVAASANPNTASAALSLDTPEPVAAGTSVTFEVSGFEGIRNPMVLLDCDGSEYDLLSPIDANGYTYYTLTATGTTCSAWVIRHPQYGKPLSNIVTFAVV